jgi:hypothetical protein
VCSYNNCYSRKAVSICRLILLSVACPAVQYFSKFSHKQHSFPKIITEHKVCVLIFSTTFVWKTSHCMKKWARYDKKYVGLHVKCPLSCSIIWNVIFFDSYSKNLQISNFMKICPVGAELFHVDGWTDMMKLIVAFCSFAIMPK